MTDAPSAVLLAGVTAEAERLIRTTGCGGPALVSVIENGFAPIPSEFVR